jgi:membrane protease subunit (stomatin/prohibitin family)
MGMGMMMPGGAMGMNGMGNFQGYQQQPVQQQPQYQQPVQPVPVAQPVEEPLPAPEVDPNAWVCACGVTNTSKFCHNCGSQKPEPVVSDEWTCACGSINKGKFCPNCGTKKPEKKTLKCDKCGWVAQEGQITKFCPECGDPVTEVDFK